MQRIMTTEVAVIGAGLIGSWTAFFLRKRGLSTILLEKGATGAQSSGVNFGNLRLQGRYPGQFPLALRSYDIWENLEALIGNACEFESTGHAYLAFDDEQYSQLEHKAADAADYGLFPQLLSRSETLKKWPWLAANVRGASWSSRDAVANPRLVTPEVARAAQRLGVQLLENTLVEDIRSERDRFVISTRCGLRIECGHVVNAAGAWAGQVSASFGEPVPMFSAGPPQFVTEPLPYFIKPSFQAVDGTVIFRQVNRGNVVVAGYPRGASDAIANRAPVQPDKTLNAMRRLREVVPLLGKSNVIRVWSGIEGYMPDMLPVIGPSITTPGLLHAFGFCGHGFTLGPGVGLALSEIIADGHTDTPLVPFSIGRFSGELQTDAARLAREFDSSLIPVSGTN